MRCPFCGGLDDRVLDSREAPDGASIKRRRECKACTRRYTTYEQIEEMALYVVKSGGRRESFDRAKALKGMELACKGRPVSREDLANIAEDIERQLYNRGDREVPSLDVGELVMERLRALDQVAYVRFASVYKQFEDAGQFKEIVDLLRRKRRG